MSSVPSQHPNLNTPRLLRWRCPDSVCAERNVAFWSEDGLKAHRKDYHSSTCTVTFPGGVRSTFSRTFDQGLWFCPMCNTTLSDQRSSAMKTHLLEHGSQASSCSEAGTVGPKEETDSDEDVQFVRWIRREDQEDSRSQSADAEEVERVLEGQYEDDTSSDSMDIQVDPQALKLMYPSSSPEMSVDTDIPSHDVSAIIVSVPDAVESPSPSLHNLSQPVQSQTDELEGISLRENEAITEAVSAFVSSVKLSVDRVGPVFMKHGYSTDVALDWLAENALVPEIKRFRLEVISCLNNRAWVQVYVGLRERQEAAVAAQAAHLQVGH
ncbi:hypothetical protein PHLGIDRAFT_436262 [Phlebiopsis gigantea 11061_1 CR5-6]|uniref:Uncharacterized protein n=1 Tax=Phlebiopsis gigantea (strain 11061_1 CR5-6) TaxID=745531 RepID=A0A0C3SF87_PHLG1|nr:hypothetical protein PHLGIDRAFT_436262 [Phlebiopsis gigantea 11061_1 CR5-6]